MFTMPADRKKETKPYLRLTDRQYLNPISHSILQNSDTHNFDRISVDALYKLD